MRRGKGVGGEEGRAGRKGEEIGGKGERETGGGWRKGRAGKRGEGGYGKGRVGKGERGREEVGRVEEGGGRVGRREGGRERTDAKSIIWTAEPTAPSFRKGKISGVGKGQRPREGMLTSTS